MLKDIFLLCRHWTTHWYPLPRRRCNILTDLVLSELNQLSAVPFIPLLSTPFFVPFLGKLLAQVGQARYPTWASTLPNMGKHVAPPGHISFSSRAQNQPFFITPISSSFRLVFTLFQSSLPIPLTPSYPILFRPRQQLQRLHEIVQTASGEMSDIFPSNTPNSPAGSVWKIVVNGGGR